MTYRRYPNQNRVPDRDYIYLKDYINQLGEDIDTLIGSVGSDIILLKNYKIPSHEIDHVGNNTVKGNYGGRRQLQPIKIKNPNDIASRGGEEVIRPNKENTYIIPAIVDLSPSDVIRQRFGLFVQDTGIVNISKFYLLNRNLKIDESKDYFNIFGNIFKIRTFEDNTDFLNNSAFYTYAIKGDF